MAAHIGVARSGDQPVRKGGMGRMGRMGRRGGRVRCITSLKQL